MPEPTGAQGHVDELLTNVSVARMQDDTDYVAGAAFPIVPVRYKTGIYWEYPAGTFFRDDVGPRPINSRAPITGHKLIKGSFACESEWLMAAVDDEERAQWSPGYDGERVKVRQVTEQHMLHRDKRFVNAYMKTGVWTTDITGVASAPGATTDLFWNLGTSNPSKTIRGRKRGIKKLGVPEGNVLIMGSDVEQALIQHPDFIDRVKYTGDALSMDLVQAAKYFGVDKVRVATAINDTANEGLAFSPDWIVGAKDALLVYAAPEPGLEVVSAGYIIAWTGLLGDGAAAPAGVMRYRVDIEHTDYFETGTAYQMKVVAPDAGVFFHNLVQ